MTTVERFWSKVDKGGAKPSHVPGIGNCWNWTGGKFPEGYGAFGIELATGYCTARAHRVSWMLANGEWPKLCVLHRCDNPSCVRPGHLFLGTNTENVADRTSKGRSARGDANGSRRHPERLLRGDSHHSRRCPGMFAGAKNGRAKLTEAQAMEIIRRKAAGERHKSLAEEFGVSDVMISYIGRTMWKHLAIKEGV